MSDCKCGGNCESEKKARGKHDHCEHKTLAYCARCNAVECKDCSEEFKNCDLNHYPNYPIYWTPYRDCLKPYFTWTSTGGNVDGYYTVTAS